MSDPAQPDRGNTGDSRDTGNTGDSRDSGDTAPEQPAAPTRTTLDAPTVRALLQEQHPDLAALPLHPVTGGWDNQLWRLGDEFAVRVPCTGRASELLRKELHWLPRLAPDLPLPVPRPLRAGTPSERFPRPWAVTTWIPGEPSDRAAITRPAHAADTLARFLLALHRPAPADAPPGTGRGTPLAEEQDPFDHRIRILGPAGLAADSPSVRSLWKDASSAPEYRGPRLWLHGDLHPANVVVTDGTLSGVLDFGDLSTGDPAADLAAAWVLLPVGSATRLFDAYGPVDRATVRRARGRALLCALSLISVGLAWERGLPGGQPTWGPAGRAALERVLASA
ncbi:aminoglycoside phosphotransferase family protein [Kitasatospora sp. NPDC059577]|uniref:aminoglycoside phosphotransferase family protein n=1 Tax=Kitasatospora sp. NPDC059577 TaxID=3346873 RepID=UPI00369E1EE4